MTPSIRNVQARSYADPNQLEMATFFGEQVHAGFFSSTVHQVTIKVMVHKFTFTVENGVDSRIPLRNFTLADV